MELAIIAAIGLAGYEMSLAGKAQRHVVANIPAVEQKNGAITPGSMLSREAERDAYARGAQKLPMQSGRPMMPFFGSSVKQPSVDNLDYAGNLERFTGIDAPSVGPKQEQPAIFAPTPTVKAKTYCDMDDAERFANFSTTGQSYNKETPTPAIRVGPGVGIPIDQQVATDGFNNSLNFRIMPQTPAQRNNMPGCIIPGKAPNDKRSQMGKMQHTHPEKDWNQAALRPPLPSSGAYSKAAYRESYGLKPFCSVSEMCSIGPGIAGPTRGGAPEIEPNCDAYTKQTKRQVSACWVPGAPAREGAGDIYHGSKFVQHKNNRGQCADNLHNIQQQGRGYAVKYQDDFKPTLRDSNQTSFWGMAGGLKGPNGETTRADQGMKPTLRDGQNTAYAGNPAYAGTYVAPCDKFQPTQREQCLGRLGGGPGMAVSGSAQTNYSWAKCIDSSDSREQLDSGSRMPLAGRMNILTGSAGAIETCTDKSYASRPAPSRPNGTYQSSMCVQEAIRPDEYNMLSRQNVDVRQQLANNPYAIDIATSTPKYRATPVLCKPKPQDIPKLVKCYA